MKTWRSTGSVKPLGSARLTSSGVSTQPRCCTLAQLVQLFAAILRGKLARTGLKYFLFDRGLHVFEGLYAGWLVIGQARCHDRSGSDLDRLGIALVDGTSSEKSACSNFG